MNELIHTFFTPWWPDLASFLGMGRHGAYVWPSLALCALAGALEWAALGQRACRLAQVAEDGGRPDR